MQKRWPGIVRPSRVASKGTILRKPTASPPWPASGVYVLELPGGRYYVGKSGDIPERLRQHASGEGSACAKGFIRRAPVITPRTADLESWERAETLARMRRHGNGRVRGWLYTAPELGPAMREHAFQQVCERFDLCRRCGEEGHFVTQCRNGDEDRPAWALA